MRHVTIRIVPALSRAALVDQELMDPALCPVSGGAGLNELLL